MAQIRESTNFMREVRKANILASIVDKCITVYLL